MAESNTLLPSIPLSFTEIKLDTIDPLKLDTNKLPYTKFYCEENVWKLVELISQLEGIDMTKFYVLICSNNLKRTPFFHHKNGKVENMYLQIWDYHVFVIYKESKEKLYVYDLDSCLPSFPVTFSQYVQLCLQPHVASQFNEGMQRMYRIVKATDYLEKFASDRSHMKESNGNFYSPPPPWPAIENTSSKNNIDEFTTIKKNSAPGIICTESDLLQLFS